MYEVLDGKKRSQEIFEKVKLATERLAAHNVIPKLVVFTVGYNPASSVYLGQKKKKLEAVGFQFEWVNLPDTIQQEELNDVIQRYNQDLNTSGIVVQLPLPPHIDQAETMLQINPEKDVDGFHPMTVGKIVGKQGELYPCTPKGIMSLLAHYEIELAGKTVTIIGRSQIVGLPLAIMMINQGATVSVCNSKTPDLSLYTQHADIVVAATGQANLLNATHIRQGAIVVDVGINYSPEGKLVGDVDFESVAPKTRYITPVPGGVGPMTVAMLLEQTFSCCCKQHGLNPDDYLGSE